MKQAHPLFLKVYIPDRPWDTEPYAAMNVQPVPVWQEFKQGETLMICNYEKEQAKEMHIYHTAFSASVFMIMIIITKYVDKND